MHINDINSNPLMYNTVSTSLYIFLFTGQEQILIVFPAQWD